MPLEIPWRPPTLTTPEDAQGWQPAKPLRWLRGLDLNQRPLGYEAHGGRRHPHVAPSGRSEARICGMVALWRLVGPWTQFAERTRGRWLMRRLPRRNGDGSGYRRTICF